MVFIERYIVKKIGDNKYKIVSYENPTCPYCGSIQKMIGTKHRLVRLSDGSSVDLIIRRLRCPNLNCRKINHELPDFLLPYYRYDKNTIMSVISEAMTMDGLPCEEGTVKRWKEKFKN